MKFTKSIITVMNNNDELTDLDGYTFECDLPDGSTVVMGVHKHGGRWHVDDLATGMYACTNCETRAKAIECCTDPTFLKKYAEYITTERYAAMKDRFEYAVSKRDVEAAVAKAAENAADDDADPSADASEEAAVEITLESMQKWATERGLYAMKRSEGAHVVRVYGIRRADVELREEIKKLGFRWNKDEKYWWANESSYKA